MLPHSPQILPALVYIHSCYIMHRDLKCDENIFLDKRERGRAGEALKDFGFTEIFDRREKFADTFLDSTVRDVVILRRVRRLHVPTSNP